MRFNVGDTVTIAPRSMWFSLLNGDTGTVRQIIKDGWSYQYAVKFPIVGDIYCNEQDLAPAPKRCIVARTLNGIVSPSARPFLHDNRELATTEAERLAVANPGVPFIVYEAVGISHAEKPVAKTVAA